MSQRLKPSISLLFIGALQNVQNEFQNNLYEYLWVDRLSGEYRQDN